MAELQRLSVSQATFYEWAAQWRREDKKISLKNIHSSHNINIIKKSVVQQPTNGVLYVDGVLGGEQHHRAVVWRLEADPFLCDLRQLQQWHHLEASAVLVRWCGEGGGGYYF